MSFLLSRQPYLLPAIRGKVPAVTILAIASQKGGVGKTTIALNLAFAVARRGFRTLLVDGDPQGGIGHSLTGDLGAKRGFMECLDGSATIGDLALGTRESNFRILPSGKAAGRRARERTAPIDEEHLRSLFSDVSADLILLDTASGLSGSTWDLLRAADFLLIPLQSEPLAVRGLSEVLESVQDLRRGGASIRLAGFLLTMVDTGKAVSRTVVRDVWEAVPTDMLLSALVPRHDAFLEASAAGVPVGLMGKTPPPVAAIFDQLAADLEPRLGLVHEEAAEPISLWS